MTPVIQILTKIMCEIMSKVSKEDLTVLIVTQVTHVDRVKSGVCGSKQCVKLDLCQRG